MANDNNNINELVANDDDPTAELELPTFRQYQAECDAKTFGTEDGRDASGRSTVSVASLKAELRARDKTIDRLQYDVQQLQSQCRGVETEIAARTAQTRQLNNELAATHDSTQRKQQLIKKRDRKIKLLKLEIRQRDENHQQLSTRCEGLQLSLDATTSIVENVENATAAPPATALTTGELELRLNRSEDYADSMRMQLQDILEAQRQAERETVRLSSCLQESRAKGTELGKELTQEKAQTEHLQSKLASIQDQHENEIRLLRFDLGEAQDTVVETGDLNCQLASDLVDARGFKDELEHMLADAEEQSTSHIGTLQKKVSKLMRTVDSYEQKLSTKSAAISILLAELAKKAEQIDLVGESPDDFPVTGDRTLVSGFEGEEKESHPSVERTTRVLIGTVDDQVLRFPLFKDRLTIGRTTDNDIQLKAAYVSRRHAVIQTDGDTTRIIDWGSKNGIRVNSKRISEHFLSHGDIVVIGKARFRYEERKKR